MSTTLQLLAYLAPIFAVFKTDSATSDGQEIEEPWAIVRVTLVQVSNNLSQGKVIGCADGDYVRRTARELERARQVKPPRNIAVPYVRPEFSSMSLAHIRVVREHLESLRASIAEAATSGDSPEDQP